VIFNTSNPEWNQSLYLQCMLPNQSKYISLSLYDRDILSKLSLLLAMLIGADDLIGQYKFLFH